MTDNIFARLHSLSPPGPLDETPIVIAENPSRDFDFPASAVDIVGRINYIDEDAAGITHLWLRRVSGERFANGAPLAEFVCGSGVRVIVLYPWRSDLRMPLGNRRPSPKTLRSFSEWTTDLRRTDGTWWLMWDADAARAYTLDQLVVQMIGTHLDQHKNQWSAANRSTTERRAESYAIEWNVARTLRTDAPTEPAT